MPPTEDDLILPSDPPNYEGLPLIEQIRLLQEWGPLIGFGRRFIEASDAYARTLISTEALAWLSQKTAVRFDDELVSHVNKILLTKEGEEFVRWVVSLTPFTEEAP